MVNVNIEIPDALHKRLKVAATLDGTTLKEHIIARLDAALAKRQPEGADR